MNNMLFNFPNPENEPIKGYMKGSQERESLSQELERQSNIVVDIPQAYFLHASSVCKAGQHMGEKSQNDHSTGAETVFCAHQPQ